MTTTQDNRLDIAIENLFPENINVSGFPFMLQGWNNSYYKTSEKSEGFPVYRLDPYILYWTIPIIGVNIKMIDGEWRIIREDGMIIAKNKLLMGRWKSSGYDINITS